MNDSNDSWSLNNLRKEESLWEEAQKKTFCGWLNMHLGKRDLRVQDLSTDLSDGVKLIALLEILNNSKIEGRYYRNPKSKPYKIDNVNFALNFITDTLKIKLISCSAEDVVDGNVKIILGMLWRLIQKFQLTTDNSRAELLNWCKKITASYNGVSVENFQSSFENGLAFCALVHHYNPSLLDFNSLKPENKLQNLQLAFNVAEEHLEIPALLDAKDISNGLVDERSVMTYISMIQQNSSKPPASSTTATTPKSENASSQKETPKSPEVDHTASLTIASIESEVAALKQTILKLEADLGVSSHRERDLAAQLEATKAELKAALQKQSELQAEIDLLREQAATAAAAAASTTPSASNSTTTEGDESKREAVKVEEKEVEVVDKPVVEEHVVPVQVRDSPREPVKPVKQPEPVAAATEPVKQVEKSEEKSASETKKEESSSVVTPAAAADTDKKEAPSADLQNEILETRDKLRQQVKVSETLQKSLEDTREEIVLIQKGQKRAQDKALKKQQKRYEKRIQRRDKEIESLKKNYEAEMQQKNNELQNLQNQLKKAQKALGGAVEPETSALDADIEYLKQQKEELLIIVQNFEEEERALAKKSARRIEEEDDKEGSESERV